MAYNTARGRRVWHRQIQRVGGRTGAIVRGATEIPIVVAVGQYSARERTGGLIEPADVRLVISTFRPNGTDLGTVPDKETDTIRVDGDVPVTYNMVAPPTLYDPHGVLMVIEVQGRK